MSLETRWDRAQELYRTSPCDDISVEFVAWTLSQGDHTGDPLKDKQSFHAAWRGWKAGRDDMVESERKDRIARWCEDSGVEFPG